MGERADGEGAGVSGSAQAAGRQTGRPAGRPAGKRRRLSSSPDRLAVGACQVATAYASRHMKKAVGAASAPPPSSSLPLPLPLLASWRLPCSRPASDSAPSSSRDTSPKAAAAVAGSATAAPPLAQSCALPGSATRASSSRCWAAWVGAGRSRGKGAAVPVWEVCVGGRERWRGSVCRREDHPESFEVTGSTGTAKKFSPQKSPAANS